MRRAVLVIVASIFLMGCATVPPYVCAPIPQYGVLYCQPVEGVAPAPEPPPPTGPRPNEA
jgi:hypothetical protein